MTRRAVGFLKEEAGCQNVTWEQMGAARRIKIGGQKVATLIAGELRNNDTILNYINADQQEDLILYTQDQV
eukprot:8913715-Karenia_brevis.AAC.1